VIGVDAAAKSAPAGHTLVIVSNSFTVNHTLVPKLPYDTKDLRPVGLLTRSPNMLVGHTSVAARDLPAMLAYAKANPAGDAELAVQQIGELISVPDVELLGPSHGRHESQRLGSDSRITLITLRREI
jgi:hypothetical protein